MLSVLAPNHSAKVHIVAFHLGLLQSAFASLAFLHFVGTTSTNLECNSTANASLSKKCLHSILSNGNVQISTVSRSSRSWVVTDSLNRVDSSISGAIRYCRSRFPTYLKRIFAIIPLSS